MHFRNWSKHYIISSSIHRTCIPAERIGTGTFPRFMVYWMENTCEAFLRNYARAGPILREKFYSACTVQLLIMQFYGVSGPSDAGGRGSISSCTWFSVCFKRGWLKQMYLLLGSLHQKITVRTIKNYKPLATVKLNHPLNSKLCTIIESLCKRAWICVKCSMKATSTKMRMVAVCALWDCCMGLRKRSNEAAIGGDAQRSRYACYWALKNGCSTVLGRLSAAKSIS